MLKKTHFDLFCLLNCILTLSQRGGMGQIWTMHGCE